MVERALRVISGGNKVDGLPPEPSSISLFLRLLCYKSDFFEKVMNSLLEISYDLYFSLKVCIMKVRKM